jgi:hypothetical protein
MLRRVESLDSTVGIVALAAAGVAALALLCTLVLWLRLRRVRRAQRAVLGEHDERDLVAHAARLQARVEQLSEEIDATSAALLGRMDVAEEKLRGTVCRTAVLRYDAFNETSGRQSSTVAMLDRRGNGVVLSAILQREQARVYAKPLTAGDSELELSPEERRAIEQARQVPDGELPDEPEGAGEQER